MLHSDLKLRIPFGNGRVEDISVLKQLVYLL
jgi:hypothetical protein